MCDAEFGEQEGRARLLDDRREQDHRSRCSFFRKQLRAAEDADLPPYWLDPADFVEAGIQQERGAGPIDQAGAGEDSGPERQELFVDISSPSRILCAASATSSRSPLQQLGSEDVVPMPLMIPSVALCAEGHWWHAEFRGTPCRLAHAELCERSVRLWAPPASEVAGSRRIAFGWPAPRRDFDSSPTRVRTAPGNVHRPGSAPTFIHRRSLCERPGRLQCRGARPQRGVRSAACCRIPSGE